MADPSYMHTNAPGRNSFTITPDTDADLPYVTRQLFVGTGGNVSGWLQGDDTATDARIFRNLPDGATLSYAFKRISAASTAANMVGVY